MGDRCLDANAGTDDVQRGETEDELRSNQARSILGHNAVGLDQDGVANQFGCATEHHDALVAMRGSMNQAYKETDEREPHGRDTQEDGPLVISPILDDIDIG